MAWKATLNFLDGVLMLLSEQADDTARPIDNHCKQTGDVTAQHAHVERFQFGDSGILAPEHHLASLLTSEPNLGFDDDRIGHTPYTAEASLSNHGLETERRQHGRTEHGAIRAGIN